MHHSPFESKKARVAFRSFIYGMMTISTIVISALCLLLVLGYRFDRQELTFQQGGLIQFVSTPEGASVYFDGEKENFDTPGKSTYPAGTHDIRLTLNGYNDWKKEVQVKAGSVLWLNYTRLVPQKLITENLHSYENLNTTLPSPNNRYIAIQESAQQPKITIANIRNADKLEYEEITLPVNSYAAATGSGKHEFKILEWNGGGRYLIVLHKVNDVQEYLRIDREQPEEVVNISAFHTDIKDVRFADGSGDNVYALQQNNLKILDVNSNDSRDIVGGVASYELGRGGLVAYTAEREGMLEVSVIKGDDETVIKKFPLKTKLKVDVNRYYGDDYLALAYGNTAEIYRDPMNAIGYAKRFTIDANAVEWIYFSDNGRILVTQNQGRVTAYDIELDRNFSYALNNKQKITKPFTWLDNYYLWADFDGSLRMFEYDGANQSVITKASPGFSATLSENGKYIYSFGGEQAGLQRTNLTVVKD